VGCLIPPLQCTSVKIGAPQFLSLLLSQDWCSYRSFGTQFPLVPLGLDSHFHIQFNPLYPTPLSPCGAILHGWVFLNPCQCLLAWIGLSLIPIGTCHPRLGTLFHSVLLQPLLYTPLFHRALPIRCTTFRVWLLPIFIRILPPFQTPIQFSR
jgi:hypothetical protein